VHYIDLRICAVEYRQLSSLPSLYRYIYIYIVRIMGFVASAADDQRLPCAFRVDASPQSGSDRRQSRASIKRPSSTSSNDGDGDTRVVAEQWPTVRLNLRGCIESDEVTHRDNSCVEFTLKRVLGAGGFGRVYLADSTSSLSIPATTTGSADQLYRADEGTCRNRRNRRCRRRGDPPVVIKLLTSTATGKGGVSASVSSSLRSESNAIGLDHPNVARVLAAGWTTATRNVFDAGSSRIRKWSAGAVDQLMRAATCESSMAAIVMEFAGQSNLQSILDDSTVTIDLRRRVR